MDLTRFYIVSVDPDLEMNYLSFLVAVGMIRMLEDYREQLQFLQSKTQKDQFLKITMIINSVLSYTQTKRQHQRQWQRQRHPTLVHGNAWVMLENRSQTHSQASPCTQWIQSDAAAAARCGCTLILKPLKLCMGLIKCTLQELQ